MSAERWYRLLLRAYPPAFRARYAQEMLLAFRQCRRDAVESAPRFWAAMLWDVARSAPALRLEAMRARWSMDLHITEGAMKAMAILATLIGALEVVNSLIEGVGGGVHRPATQLLSVGLGVAGGIVLMEAGIDWVTPHAFRRTVATVLDRASGPDLAAELLGHTSSKITKEHYIQPDEAVDPITAQKINELIIDLQSKLNVTSVVVTHDIQSAFSVGDRIAFLNKGVFEWVGSMEAARDSDHPVLREFFKASAVTAAQPTH